MARILVTGAGGFIGRALCPLLVARGHHVIAGLRRAPTEEAGAISGAEPRILGDISPERIWSDELSGAEVVIHLAQRAHRRAIGGVLSGEPEAAVALARAAARAGAHRFFYVSSIKAMGEVTSLGRPFRAADQPCPGDAYGRAKLMTEQALMSAATSTGFELTIVRPPLVYGPGVGGNFRALIRLAGCGLPLPFRAVDNRRSLIFVENLVDLIATAVVHPVALRHVLLARDGADLSTATLIRVLAAGQGKQARLFAAPEALLAALRLLPLCGPVLSRMTLSLQVDDAETRDSLGWEPPVAAEAGLMATARSQAVR